ncbi:MAG: hypothetical protein F9K47_18145, partial [Burkholderiales bacterium]
MSEQNHRLGHPDSAAPVQVGSARLALADLVAYARGQRRLRLDTSEAFGERIAAGAAAIRSPKASEVS